MYNIKQVIYKIESKGMDVVKYQIVEKANTGLHSKKNIEK